MATNDIDHKPLARAAIWARLFCALIHGRRKKSSGFDSREWSRLLELAAAVDRKTLFRFMGSFAALMLCGCMLMSGLLIIAIGLLHPPLPPTASFIGWAIMLGAGISATITMLLAYCAAANVAAGRDLAGVLTARAGDAELIAKVGRQNVWIVGASVVSVVAIIAAFLAFGDLIRPFLDEWHSVIVLLGAAIWVDIVIRTFRRPQTPSDEHPGAP